VTGPSEGFSGAIQPDLAVRCNALKPTKCA